MRNGAGAQIAWFSKLCELRYVSLALWIRRGISLGQFTVELLDLDGSRDRRDPARDGLVTGLDAEDFRLRISFVRILLSFAITRVNASWLWHNCASTVRKPEMFSSSVFVSPTRVTVIN